MAGGRYLTDSAGARLLNRADVGLSTVTANARAGTAYMNGPTFRYLASVSKQVGGVWYQVAAFWNASGYMAFAKRTIGSAVWTTYTTGIAGTMTDPHNTISLGVDPAGYLHVSYDHHDSALKYRRSTTTIAAFDGTLTGALSMRGANEASVSYPTFIHGPAGKLYFIFRDGASGNGDLYFYQYDEGTQAWSAAVGAAGLLINGKVSSLNAYWWYPTFDPAGNLHLFWCWRDSWQFQTNYNLCYARWDGASWAKADGTAQTVPITAANCETAVGIPQGSSLVNQGWSDSDSGGHPHAVYMHEEATGTYVHLYHLWHDGANWIECELTDTAIAVPVGEPDNAFGTALPRPSVVVDRTDDRVYMLFHDRDIGTGLWVLRSGAGDYTTWSRFPLYAVDFGTWEPCYDRPYWEATGRLHLPVAEWFSSGGPFTIKMLEWQP